MSIDETLIKEAPKKARKSPNFNDKISREIWKILSNPDENLIENLNSIIEKSFRLIAKSNLDDPKVQKKIFDQILSFLNNLFWKLDIKKFYNNIPKTDIQKYSGKSLWEQFIHNIYWKQRKLFYRDEIWWWSCSYWTILLKHFFEELENRWMDLKSDIFFYPHNDLEGWRWHSGVIISFQWKEYLADFWWFNHAISNKIIQSIDGLNEIYSSNNFDSFRTPNIKKYYKLRDKKEDRPKNILFFHDTESFANRWSQRWRTNATIEFVPKLDWKQSKEVKFEFQPDKVYLTVDNIEYIFSYKNDNKPTKDIPDKKFFDYFISHIQHLRTIDKSTKKPISTTWEKSTFTEYLNLIHNKVSIEKLRKIYNV